MPDSLTPQNDDQVLDAVQWAVSERAPLEIIGQGSKRTMGRPMQTAATLDLSGMSGITLYEPEELVLSAKSGTPLAEIEAVLEENNQELQFEPMDYGPLLGLEAGRGTIGGLLSTNLCGPRRIKAGSARDHILGIKAVSGRGEMFKSGGRVVKNVTGYDLSKGLAGSWGTLAVTTDVTFKVLPKAETACTVVVRGLLDDAAAAVMAAAMGSSAEVSAAAHLPEYIASLVLDGELGSEPATLLRLEGVKPSVDYRARALEAMFEKTGTVARLDEGATARLWRDIRDCTPFAGSASNQIWRLSVTPSRGHEILFQLRQQMAAQAYFDWQGGLIWLAVDEDNAADTIRQIIHAQGGGHATLVRADAATRQSVPVFEPQEPALAALSARLMENFDPHNILNPGRMV